MAPVDPAPLTEDPDMKPFDVDLITDAVVGMHGFRWDLTPQGHAYWSEVDENLQRVLEIAKEREKARG